MTDTEKAVLAKMEAIYDELRKIRLLLERPQFTVVAGAGMPPATRPPNTSFGPKGY